MLENGRRLGAYEIIAPLGAGGMGEVYRARDPRLERDVAIKVLPPELAQDADRRSRFEREARAASSLNHPNIVTVHETGESGGLHYLVMELVDGSSLRQLLAGGPLPLRRVLGLAAQIADGLAKAHEAGLVHRDLKPENLMVTRDGYAKVLDFGLAKASLPAAGASQDQTMERQTASGTVLGTVGYMSPEQAAGRPVDYRSDLFSFGCVLYELLTSRRAFQGDTAVDTLAAILHQEPPPLPEPVPEPVRWIVERCLAKDPLERYAATRDLARDLRRLAEASSHPTVVTRALAAPARARRSIAALMAIAAVLAIAASFWAGRQSARRPVPSLKRLSYRRGTIWSARFTPDGNTVVYAAAWDGGPVELFSTTSAGGLEARPLAFGSADVAGVAPNGDLALLLGRRYFQGRERTGTLARASLSGAAARELLLDVREAEFLPDGSDLLVVHEVNARIRLATLAGTVLHESNGWLSHLRASPDGRHVAFLEHPVRRDDRGRLVVLDLRTRQPVFTSDEWGSIWGVAWAPGGREVWCSGGQSLVAYELSGRRRRLMQLPEYTHVLDIDRSGRVLLSHDASNHVIFGALARDTGERNLSWLNQSFPADISPDGRSLLFTEFAVGAHYGVYFRKSSDQPAVQLGEGAAMALSPDGGSALAVVFDEPPRLMLLPTGAGQPRELPRGTVAVYHSACFFPDGQRVLFTANEKGAGIRAFVQEVAGGDPKAITPEGVAVHFGSLVSPDGRHAALSMTGKGSFLFPIAGGEPTPIRGLQVSEAPLRFTADGRGLYAAQLDRPRVQIVRVELATGARSLWKELAPSDPAGAAAIFAVSLVPEAGAYAFGTLRVLSSLMLVEGLR